MAGRAAAGWILASLVLARADLEILEERGGGDGKVIRKVSYAVERHPLITGADIETARPSRGGIRSLLLGGCAFVFLLFLATLVWLYRRSDPARRTPG
jgi:hypothetical protein